MGILAGVLGALALEFQETFSSKLHAVLVANQAAEGVQGSGFKDATTTIFNIFAY